ncbi:MAG TPA: YraN family protein [Bacteroidia bacterium]|nr:YraN family protein [Bacteroidia bacterium]
MNTGEHIALGKRGEAIARNFLIKSGYRIRACNWKYLKGEIDIIAETGDVIVMVEVKSRSSLFFGDPEEAIGKKKLRMLFDTAARYMDVTGCELEVRYDVITVVFHGETWTIEHIPDTYYPFMNT